MCSLHLNARRAVPRSLNARACGSRPPDPEREAHAYPADHGGIDRLSSCVHMHRVVVDRRLPLRVRGGASAQLGEISEIQESADRTFGDTDIVVPSD